MLVSRRFIGAAAILLTGLFVRSFASENGSQPTRADALSAVHRLAESGYSPADLVRAALERAAAGDLSNRNQYLTKAIERDADFAPARWHAGYLHKGGRWLTIGEANALARQDELLTEYRKRRDACPDTIAGQLKLARWCLSNGLKD